MLQLNREGYVTAYLVTDPTTTPFEAPYELPDQIDFEREMRAIFYREPSGCPTEAALGALAPNLKPWRFYAANRNPYVDLSSFYFNLQRVTFYASTVLVSDRACEVRVRIWSYAAFDLWQSNRHVACEKVPVYKPIRCVNLTLSLQKGENPLFFCIQNLGVRDTRTMLSLRVLDPEGITCTLPIPDDVFRVLLRAEEFFAELRVRGDSVTAPFVPPFPVSVACGKSAPMTWCEGTTYPIGDAFSVKLTAEVLGQSFSRVFECYEKQLPLRRAWETDNPLLDNARRVVARAVGRDEVGLIYDVPDHMLPLYALNHIMLEGRILPDDCRGIRLALAKVRQRIDCSDFALSCIFRILIRYGLPKELSAELRETALNFRYWMDEDGADAMCFWSENHALVFHACQMIAGQLYPDAIFTRSGRTGREQNEIGRRRVNEWLDTVTREGFEEFCAGGYMCVTSFALLMVHDFGDPDMKPRAAALLDRIARSAALQCFDGVHLSPMGRVYRTVLSPHLSGLQGLLHIIDDSAADGADTWFGALGTSDYRLPDGLAAAMHGAADAVYSDGYAEIHTNKTEANLLTSLASPRTLPLPARPETETEYDRTRHMNERTEVTAPFNPGTGGYQQHLWYAALSNRFFVFVNHPGSERDFGDMRPGYWFGNLVFPTLRQIGRELFCHYAIPENVPTSFTHAYFPAYAADEVVIRDGFRFARVGDGFLALWCSSPLELWEGDAVVDADLRAYSRDVAWYVTVGSVSEDGSFEAFIDTCLGKALSLETVKRALAS